MQKELIYDKMNGFLTDGLPSLAEGTVVEDEFAEGKECCLLYEGVSRQAGICANGWEKTRIVMWKLF